MTPRATYRLQFNQDFTFADAEAIVPYLARLGISHLYASPITVARAGSTHGYDVVDHTRIDPVLGGEEGFRRLVALLRAHDMGVILDIVPNHMGVAGGGNAWWNDVLANGQASDFATYFDINWRRPILLPILGTTLDEAIGAGAIEVVAAAEGLELVVYGEHRIPLRPDDREPPRDEAALRALLERQHYRLGWWRTANDLLNWRRFFTINELAGVRIEDSAVFEAVHALVFRLYRERLIDGVRVDHVDGLADPAGYCRTLRARLDAIDRPGEGRAYIVVEKILGSGEALATDWGVDGTSGYDFMAAVTDLLHDPAGERALTDAWAEIGGRSRDFAAEELLARQQLLDWQFAAQFDACVAAFAALCARQHRADTITPAMLRRGCALLLHHFPVYRTYATGKGAPASDAVVRDRVRAAVAPHVPPGEHNVVDWILGILAGASGADGAEAALRLQQLSAPIAAKSVEDTAFYRYGRLLSRNDVGFDAAHWSSSIEDFFAAMETRAARWPRAMLATATHDHKRGEDVRARLAVLSEMPELWLAEVARWEEATRELGTGIDPGDRYMLWQTLVGSWPSAGPDAAFLDRIRQWQQKALREAKLRSSWEAPDDAYEARYAGFAETILSDERATGLRALIAAFVGRIGPAARRNALVQTALRYTCPGVPDLYQGTELEDLSLVDPDNRRPVDYRGREQSLEQDSDEKLSLIASLLAARRQEPALFATGTFKRAAVAGPLAEHILAFSRTTADRRLNVAVLLHSAELNDGRDDPRWAATTITFAGVDERAATILTEKPVWFELR